MVQNEETTRIIPICTFQAHKDYLTRVLLSPDVKHLATCSADHTAKVWNLDADYAPAKVAIKEFNDRQAAQGTEEAQAEAAPTPAETTRNQNRDLLRIFDTPRSGQRSSPYQRGTPR